MNYEKCLFLGLLSFVCSTMVSTVLAISKKPEEIKIVVTTYKESGAVAAKAAWAVATASASAFIPKKSALSRAAKPTAAAPTASTLSTASPYSSARVSCSSSTSLDDGSVGLCFDALCVPLPAPTLHKGVKHYSSAPDLGKEIAGPKVAVASRSCTAPIGTPAPTLRDIMAAEAAVAAAKTARKKAPPVPPVMSLSEIMADEAEIVGGPVGAGKGFMPIAADLPEGPLDEIKRFVSIKQGKLNGYEVDQWGGHTLFKHVDKKDSYLFARFSLTEGLREAASTFLNGAVAEKAIEEIIASNRDAIDRWVKTSSPGARTTLSCRHAFVVGYGCFSNQAKTKARQSNAVLLRVADSPTGYVIFTAYPAI